MAGAHLRYLLPSQPFREVSSREQYQVTAMPSLHNMYIDIDAGEAGWQIIYDSSAAAAPRMQETEETKREE